MTPESTFKERFASRWQEDPETGCHVWAAGKNVGGYGQFWNGKTAVVAHRVAYEWARGPIPAGMVIDHLCRNRACVNVEHLEAVTIFHNNVRGLNSFDLTGLCRKGLHGPEHWGEDRKTGNRFCRTCRSKKGKAHKDLMKEAARSCGLTYGRYRARYGYTQEVARRVIAENTPEY